jgi:RES domain-containing protein
LLSALVPCDRFVTTYTETVYRVVSVGRANHADLLSGEGSRLFGSRWNPPGLFRTVYASTHIETALHETLAQNRRSGLPDKEGLPLVLCAADLRLEKVLDLNDGEVRRVLRVSLNRMRTEPHGTPDESITQAIGRLAWSRHLEGLLVLSATASTSSFSQRG